MQYDMAWWHNDQRCNAALKQPSVIPETEKCRQGLTPDSSKMQKDEGRWHEKNTGEKDWHSYHLTTWQGKIWQDQVWKKKNYVKGTCGTCGEMSPLHFCIFPKIQWNSTTMILILCCPKTCIACGHLSKVEFEATLGDLCAKCHITQKNVGPFDKMNCTTLIPTLFCPKYI